MLEVRGEAYLTLAGFKALNEQRLVAEESWGYDLAPRQIQARYPETFATVAEISPDPMTMATVSPGWVSPNFARMPVSSSQ